MKEIKELEEMKICYPAILDKQENCGNDGYFHLPEVLDEMHDKINELVREVKKLKREQGLF